MFFVMVILLVCTFLLFIHGVMVYNALRFRSQEVLRAWSNVDVLLKERHDLVPNLVKVVSGYMEYEKEVLERVVNARNQNNLHTSSIQGIEMTAGMVLTRELGTLFALCEDYADLKSDEQFERLSAQLTVIEDRLALRREFYNSTVSAFNIAIARFPDCLLARFLKEEERVYYEFQEEELSASTSLENPDSPFKG